MTMDSPLSIAVIVGSLRGGSYTSYLVLALSPAQSRHRKSRRGHRPADFLAFPVLDQNP